VYEVSDLIGKFFKTILAFSSPNFDLLNRGNAHNCPIMIGNHTFSCDASLGGFKGKNAETLEMFPSRRGMEIRAFGARNHWYTDTVVWVYGTP
jgi:hypothetical protein